MQQLFVVLMVTLVCYVADLRAQDIVLESRQMRLTLGADGTVKSVFDLAEKKEYAVSGTPFCRITEGKRSVAAWHLSLSGDRLEADFEEPTAHVTFSVTKTAHAIVLQIVKVEGNPEEIEFDAIRTVPPERATWGNILWFPDFCLALVPGEPEVRTSYGGGKEGRLSASVCRELGILNRRLAIVGCPREQLANEIEEVEKRFALPGGIGLKSNEDNRRSYLMVSGLNAENADRLIQHAKEGGFGSILMVIGTWADYGRKYVVPERNFPGGMPQLKAVVDKIHAAGMKAGAHMFSTKVPKRSEYTSPKPDPRLYKDLFTQLVQPLDEKADRIVTQEPPADWPRLPGARDVQVDDEIIEYTELSLTEPFGFTGCKRGMYGTAPAAHKAGASIGHVVTDESYGIFIIDQKTDLLDEVAQNIARTYDGAGFDWIYFDGAEDVPPPSWYTVSNAQLAVIKRVQRKPTIVQVAAAGPFGWHYITRAGQRDYFWVSMDSKDEVDDAVTRSAPNAKAALLAAEIGWFPFSAPSPTRPGRRGAGTQIDEVEYLYTKALAADAAVSMQASPATFEAHPHCGPILAIMRQLEELRVKNYFSEDVKKEVLTPHQDFMLLSDAKGAWHLKRAREIPFVAGTSEKVRAFIAEPVGREVTVSLWNVSQKMNLELALLPEKVKFADYEGRPVAVEVLPGSRIVVPVTTRLYLKADAAERGYLSWAFRLAKATPILPQMRVAQAEEGTITGRFTTAKKVGVAFANTMGDCIIPSADFDRGKKEDSACEYAFNVPKAGAWYLWARVRYEDVDSNSFSLLASGMAEPQLFGNTDATLGAWFWEGPAELELQQGANTVKVLGREGRMNLSPALDLLCLVDDATYAPNDQDVRSILRATAGELVPKK